MATERKPISKKLRFEVFKRDNFTCQYCGRMAPDVVLEVDHINPVSNGGGDDILNLVTSCFDCNRGKGKRKLSESEEIKKQQEQLKILNEKREQLKLMIEWKKELEGLENEQISVIENLFESITSANFTVHGKETIRKEIRKFGFNDVYEATEISLNQYYRENEKESIDKVFSYIGRICANRKYQRDNPIIKDVNYLAKVAKNNLRYTDDVRLKRYLRINLTFDDVEDVKGIILDSRNWTELKNNLEEYFDTEGAI